MFPPGGRPPGALLQGLRRGQRDPTGLAAASGVDDRDDRVG